MLVRLASGRRMFVDVDGEGLAIEGSNLVPRTTLLLVHGSEVDHSFFKPWVAPLARHAQLVYVDLIGHGRSDAGGATDWSPEVWAGSLDELCDSIGITNPVVLGSSMGGRLAMLLALRSPNLVRGLLLVNTVGRPRPDRRIEMFRRLGGDEAAEAARRDIEAHSPETKDAYFRLCMPLMTQRPYSSDELARLTPPAPGVFDRLVELSHESTDLLPAVGAIGCPTLVITGEYDPAATPEDAVDLAAAIGPNAHSHVVPGAGHGVYRDNPDDFLQAAASSSAHSRRRPASPRSGSLFTNWSGSSCVREAAGTQSGPHRHGGAGWYQRVMLSVDLVGRGGEMATFEPMADRILSEAPWNARGAL